MRFRLTIRDLLWLTVVVALSVGWWLNARANRVAVDRLIEAAHSEAKNQSELASKRIELMQLEIQNRLLEKQAISGQLNREPTDDKPIDNMPIMSPRPKQKFR
jgi:hypothetical protein